MKQDELKAPKKKIGLKILCAMFAFLMVGEAAYIIYDKISEQNNNTESIEISQKENQTVNSDVTTDDNNLIKPQRLPILVSAEYGGSRVGSFYINKTGEVLYAPYDIKDVEAFKELGYSQIVDSSFSEKNSDVTKEKWTFESCKELHSCATGSNSDERFEVFGYKLNIKDKIRSIHAIHMGNGLPPTIRSLAITEEGNVYTISHWPTEIVNGKKRAAQLKIAKLKQYSKIATSINVEEAEGMGVVLADEQGNKYYLEENDFPKLDWEE